MAIMVGTGRGAQLGVLIRGGEVLETANDVDTVVLDKTGTVTEGRMTVSDQWWAVDTDPRRGIDLAASIESMSDHPIARAIASLSPQRFEVVGFAETAGSGIEGTVDGRSLRIGRPSELGRPTSGLDDFVADHEQRGDTVVVVTDGDAPIGAIAVADTVKESSARAVGLLSSLGLTTILLTGDNERTAQSVGRTVGVDQVIAGVLPEAKHDTIAALQASGSKVAMIGDGINDAPALARADLGIAMGTGTAVAREAADLTLVSGDLLAAVDAVRLARRTFATIKGNLFWAFAYNVAAVPLAVAGRLGPAVAAGAMAFSSLFVVTNSLRLRRFRSVRSDDPTQES
jgi:Cu+-exporting ATPase